MAYELDQKTLTTPIDPPSAGTGRSVWQAMWKGFRCRCPRCDTGKLFSSYLKVSQECSSCGQALHHHRADDAPPYFTMFIVGHLLVPLVFWVERVWKPDLSVHAALWLPSSILLTLWLLPMVKGAIIGLQWAIGMHGFGLSDEESSLVDPKDLEQDAAKLDG
ncbi:DUF983 domain-containing protein [Anderseniella sp. Alg231-50]|uniref:DUF983 domain-containing protein n=1 Tax=Anderseniella sp. Alg231-50 TaxID=1922226 RepID=UPI00307C824D